MYICLTCVGGFTHINTHQPQFLPEGRCGNLFIPLPYTRQYWTKPIFKKNVEQNITCPNPGGIFIN